MRVPARVPGPLRASATVHSLTTRRGGCSFEGPLHSAHLAAGHQPSIHTPRVPPWGSRIGRGWSQPTSTRAPPVVPPFLCLDALRATSGFPGMTVPNRAGRILSTRGRNRSRAADPESPRRLSARDSGTCRPSSSLVLPVSSRRSTRAATTKSLIPRNQGHATMLSKPDDGHLPSDGLARGLGRLLKVHGLRIATAESCTGGRIATCLTALPDAADFFAGGVITYSMGERRAFSTSHLLSFNTRDP